MIRSLITPLSWVYGQTMAVRNKLYDRGIFRKEDFSVPVISIGNITMGGTGKTPILAELVENLRANGFRVAIVSRGYRSAITDCAEVPSESPDPSIYGDEPAMLAERFKDVPIFIGPSRVKVVRKLLNAYPNTQIIFADDAFQHRQLGRAVDVVVVDCTERLANYRSLPLGRAREEMGSLKRADFVILNKVNLCPPEQKKKILDVVEQNTRGPEVNIIEAEYYVHDLRHISTGERVEPKGFEPILAVSAIGNPKAFEELLRQKLDVRLHLIYRDHYKFGETDLKRICQIAQTRGVKRIVMTEKDAVKVRPLLKKEENFWVAELRPKMSIKVKKLFDKIIENVR